jgi:nucleotide-binding universal stress UspA family protein
MPLDGSNFSASVVPVAHRFLEEVPGAEMHLCTILDSHTSGITRKPAEAPAAGSYGGTVIAQPPPVVVESHGEALTREHAEAVDWLNGFSARELPGAVSVAHVERSHKPAAAIVALADALDVDIILMPTHGRSGLSHLVAGSVAEEVIRTSGRPVLVVGPQRDQ